MRKNYFLRRLLLSLGISILTCTLYAQTDISDAAGLAAIANNLSGSYRLTADITLTGSWTPLGSSTTPFTGTLDGNGHVIKGLTINDSGTAERGLFVETGSGATISNLGIENASVIGNERTGAIVGLMNGGLIEKCYVANSYIEGRDHVGSLCGQIKGGAVIQNCYSTANVYSREYQAGGLVGVVNDANTKITKSYFSGIVRCANNSRPAGIVAWCDNGGPIVDYCVNLAPYILGNDNLRMIGRLDAGYITMQNNYSISTCRLSSDINDYNGSTVPTNDGNYGTDKGHGANFPDGDADAKQSSFYSGIIGWDFTSTWKMLSDGYPVLQWQTAPVNTAALRLAASYSLRNGETLDLNTLVSNRGLALSFSTSSSKILINGSIATVSGVNAPEDATISILTNNDFTEVDNVLVHLFTNGPITISTPAELKAVTNYPTMNFQLTADIDMTGVAFSGLCSNASPFKGTFDGNGHIIKGLSFNSSTADNMGLFAAISGATIKKLGIEGANIIAHNDVAAIVGLMNGGLIDQCYVSNSYVEGNDHVASIAGKIYNGAIVQNCYSTANIYSRATQAGGIGGVILDANSKVSKCYFSGKVAIPTGNSRPGGIVALIDNNSGITVEYCVNLATSIIGGSNVRIIQNGSQSTYTLTSNYSLSSTIMNTLGSAVSSTDANVAANKLHGANLASDADALSSTFYTTTLGWDFASVWKLLPSGGYPVLQWQTTPSVISVFQVPGTIINSSQGQVPFISNKAVFTNNTDLNNFIVLSNAKNTCTFTSDNSKISIDSNNKITFNSQVSSIESATINIVPKSGFVLGTGVSSFTIALAPNPITISTANDLQLVETYPNANFRMINNLDMSGVSFDGLCSEAAPFTGTFDGSGYVIKNVLNNTSGIKGIGLFNTTQGATIKNLGVESSTFTGTAQNVGGVIGTMRGGLIEQCYVSNSTINGNDHTGSLVGGVNGYYDTAITGTGAIVRNCYGNAAVNSNPNQAGGLCGTVMKGTVEKCYFTGTVKCANRSIGLAGYHDFSGAVVGDVVIQNNVNLASQILSTSQYPSQTFRIFDNNSRVVTLANNYSVSSTTLGKLDLSASGLATVELTTTGRNGANLAVDADAKAGSFYTTTLGWDLINVWTINEGQSYPSLRVFSPVVTGLDPVVTKNCLKLFPNNLYNGQSFTVNNTEPCSVKIYSIQGAVVKSVTVQPHGLVSISGLPSSTYIVSLSTKDNTYFTKLVVR